MRNGLADKVYTHREHGEFTVIEKRPEFLEQ